MQWMIRYARYLFVHSQSCTTFFNGGTMNSCTPSWLHIKLTLVYSAPVGEGYGRIAFGLQMWPSIQGSSASFEDSLRKFSTQKKPTKHPVQT
jgi:hypothetical protein